MAVDMALGCSTNTVLHVPAIAREAGIDLSLDLFNEISTHTPHLCSLSPGGPHHMEDLDRAGGVPAVMKDPAGGRPGVGSVADRHRPDRGREPGRPQGAGRRRSSGP